MMRIKITENIIFFSFGLIVAALIYMQTIRGEHYYDQSVNNRIRVIPVEGPRGLILDRNGIVVADSHPAYHVAVITQDVQDSQSLFHFLGGVLKKDPRLLQKQFIRKRKTPFAAIVLGQDVDQKTVIAVEENRFLYPGLVVEKTYERHYPFAQADAHAIGYVGKIDLHEAEVLQDYGYNLLSITGKMGVEKTYDPLLRGESGGRQIEINNRGQEVRLLGLKEPAKGKDIQLTIDQRIQSAGDEFLAGRPGAVAVMDLTNGDLLGLVSSPSFDPNAFVDRNRQDQAISYIHDATAPLLNRAVAGQYPPGSVFKISVALAAIELHKITPEATFDCPGYYMLGATKFSCAHVHGQENLNQAIAHSCNVYFFHVGQIVTARIIQQYAKAFGLGRATGVDLPFEAAGQLIAGPRRGQPWYMGNTLNFSIGQGDTLTTPLQILVMMAAVANDGVIFRPRIVKAVDHRDLPGPNITKLPIVRLHDVTWRTIQQGLRSVITDEEGTAHRLNNLKGMTIYGKTGTAQAGTSKANHAWFVGYVRSPKNNLAFCVFLEHGGSSANAVAISYDLLLRMQSLGII
ncbi:MAG: penicillin-binding protein 2 [Candidatus Omnitrophica bacterium]|nr:penicillin-binding protein 2 [Candidatus Omnitrophota bacterium]